MVFDTKDVHSGFNIPGQLWVVAKERSGASLLLTAEVSRSIGGINLNRSLIAGTASVTSRIAREYIS